MGNTHRLGPFVARHQASRLKISNHHITKDPSYDDEYPAIATLDYNTLIKGPVPARRGGEIFGWLSGGESYVKFQHIRGATVPWNR